ncbi:MAG: M3 family metallopeptidase [Vulcanimicrobiota bacterium]
MSALLSRLHRRLGHLYHERERLYWRARMGLDEKNGWARAQVALQRFISSPSLYRRLQQLEARRSQPEWQSWLRLFARHQLNSPEAARLRDEIIEQEAEIGQARQGLQFSVYDIEKGDYRPVTRSELGTLLTTHPDSQQRQRAYQALVQLEQRMLELGLLELIKKRNRLARLEGHSDFYAWTVARAENWTMERTFAPLEALAECIAPAVDVHLKGLEAEHGPGSRDPWNCIYLRRCQERHELDPYFPIQPALRRWLTCFAGLGIDFHQANLTLDLMERAGKYEGGFFHAPALATASSPADIHFACAGSFELGGGLPAHEVLFHEGGHAAHVAHKEVSTPYFFHEFPTSVVHTEAQATFTESLLWDAAWRHRFAGVPLDLLEGITFREQAWRAWDVSASLTVPFGERLLYQTPEDQLVPEQLLPRLRQVERRHQGLSAGTQPLLTVIHLIDTESSAYCHAYPLAEMAAFQVRAFFFERDGQLLDNQGVGPELRRHFWEPNKPFEEMLTGLTGRGLDCAALAHECTTDPLQTWRQAQAQLRHLRDQPLASLEAGLQARYRLVDGSQLFYEGDEAEQLCSIFERWTARPTRSQRL